ncbi:kin of IRRE-like protein 3 [Mytilus edulis]|uniref:kin of IRRE-like protein 3 n=1 Tax=Mytilus edulis TaxID=6550 RepID=UPI0039F112B7
MDNKLEGTEGTDLLIRCTAEGGKPPPDVKVTILDGTGSNGIKEVNYTIPTISRDYHRRTIVCKATSNAFNISMTATAHIYLNLKPLTPIFNSKEISTEETEPLRVSCISYGSRPAATFTWSIGGKDVTSNSAASQPVTESNDTKTVTSTLTASVNRSHTNQIIICRASNTVGSVSVGKNLDVKYAPSIDVSNYTLLNSDGSTSILCIPSGNPNVYTYYKWQHMSPYGQLIRELDGNKILTLPNVRDEFKYQDSGVYVCTASNGVISSNGNLKQIGSSFITINAIPVFTVDNTEYTYGELGKSLDLSVHVYSGTKLTSVKWFKENYQVISSSDKYSVAETQNTVDVRFHNKVIKFDGYRVTLTITNITLDDFSSYVLQVANTIEQPVVYKKYMEPVGM